MRSLGILIVFVCLLLLALEHLKLIDILSVVGLIVGIYLIMFPDKAQSLVDKLKSKEPTDSSDSLNV